MSIKIFIDARCIDLIPFGVGRYTNELCKAMQKLKPDWHWIMLMYGEKERTVTKGKITKIYKNLKLNSYLAEQQMLTELLLKYNPDLSHSPWHPVPENFSKPKILTTHDMIMEKGYPEYQTPNYLKWRQFYHRSTMNADYIITPSLNTSRDLIRFYDYPVDKIKMIPEGVSDEFSSKKKLLSRIKNKYNLPDNYIFCSSHWNISYKNSELVHSAHNLLKHKNPKFPPLLSTGIKKPIYNPDWIQLPFVSNSDLITITSNALFMVYPSKDEGFGLPLLEAMACGVPVISSCRSSLPEVGANSVLYFNPDSREELAASMLLLYKSKDLRDYFIQSGQERIKLFSWENAAEQTIQLYERAILNHKPILYEKTVDWENVKILEDLVPSRKTPRHEKEFYYLAFNYLQKGYLDKAEQCLEVENYHYPNNPDVLRELGKISKEKKDWHKAEKYFKEMLNISELISDLSHIRSASFHLATCCIENKNIDEAILSLKRCIEVCPDHTIAPTLLKKILKK